MSVKTGFSVLQQLTIEWLNSCIRHCPVWNERKLNTSRKISQDETGMSANFSGEDGRIVERMLQRKKINAHGFELAALVKTIVEMNLHASRQRVGYRKPVLPS